jgi:hypothetical protein
MVERTVIRRLKLHRSTIGYPRITDINGSRIQHPVISDYIGLDTQHRLKTMSSIYNSPYKSKYSPNKNSDNWDRRFNSREYQKRLLLSTLREYGFK